MKVMRCVTLTTAALGAVLLLAPVAHSERDDLGFVRIYPEDIQWKELPGLQRTQVCRHRRGSLERGNLRGARQVPTGLMTRPHFHPEDRYAIVISGTWYTGTGDKFDPSTLLASSREPS